MPYQQSALPDSLEIDNAFNLRLADFIRPDSMGVTLCLLIGKKTSKILADLPLARPVLVVVPHCNGLDRVSHDTLKCSMILVVDECLLLLYLAENSDRV